jgi:metal-sulfur cluster biosynthetic enzyme
MTYTTPSCPEGELIQQMIKNAISEKLPTYTTTIEITFDPQRSLDMIKDQDLRRMFE